ncbi:SDR family NAD(P)-dependent oxidoreductase, partial [Xanthomonas translucens]
MPLTPPPPTTPVLPLHDRVILVTGGAQGIGRGVVQAVLGAGGRVAFGDLDAEAGRACVAELDAGERVLFRRLDVAAEASVRRFVDAALAQFGHIDGLVNNAGIADPHSGTLERLALREWNRRLGASLGGAFLCSKHALPALRDSAGG